MAAQFIAPSIKQSQLKTRSLFQHSDFYSPNYSILILGLVRASIPSDTKFFQVYWSLAVVCLLYAFLLCLERAGYTRICKSAASISYCLVLLETQYFWQITVFSFSFPPSSFFSCTCSFSLFLFPFSFFLVFYFFFIFLFLFLFHFCLLTSNLTLTFSFFVFFFSLFNEDLLLFQNTFSSTRPSSNSPIRSNICICLSSCILSLMH